MHNELQAGRAAVSLAGLMGTKAILPVDDNLIVTVASMKVGTYTVAAQPLMPCRITLTHTVVETVDTLGTVVILGTLPDTTVVQETLIPVADTEVSTVNEFATITSITGAGWVIDAGVGTADTIIVGMGVVIPSSYYFEAITNRIVASTNMKVGAYTIAAQPYVPAKITVTTVANGTADTMGTVTIVGVVDDVPTTEILTPVTDDIVTTANIYTSVISVTGAGWVIAVGNDAILVGTAEINVADQYSFNAIHVLADAVVASQTDATGATNADLTAFAAIKQGTIVRGKWNAISLTSGEAIAYLINR